MTRPHWLVVVGSSAGGIEALGEFVRGLGSHPDAAYVIAQHLSPTHASPLAEILQRETTLVVRAAADGDVLAAGTVYVTPPDCDVSVSADAIRLLPTEDTVGPDPSIDLLFRSAAVSWGERAVGVVLSGSGSDGAQGVVAVKAAGGTAIVQDPDGAGFEAMPRAAIETGAVDAVAEPSAMGPLLVALCGAASSPPALVGPPDGVILATMLADVRSATGVDFAGYKQPTLMRQIARRQAITGAADLPAYAALVASGQGESEELARRMLVSVSSFFRDPEAWAALAVHLGSLVAALPAGRQLRIWVPGCASGEEVYTVAMLAAEALGRPADLVGRLKIFATDIDQEALDVARRGHYPLEALVGAPGELRDRWSQTVGSEVEVAPVLRECTVFARHDVLSDPPFPRVDVICLRNTLIYFGEELQNRVLRLCHFALADQGLLFLGRSERVSAVDGLFAAVDKAHQLYRRSAATSVPVPRMPTAPGVSSHPTRSSGAVPAAVGERHELLGELVSALSPPTLVVDAADEVVEVVGDVAPWCWVAQGPYSNRVTALLRDELQLTARALLVQLRHGDQPSLSRAAGTADGMVVTATRLRGSHDGFVALSFVVPVDSAQASVEDAGGRRTDHELVALQESLQTMVGDLTAANESLQALNEELQASTEELQATSEELATSNEELEATNEELTTLNQELEVRSSEVVATNTDLENVQRSLNSGIVLLDGDLCVRRFNPLAVRLFALLDTDMGRPLTSIPTTAPVEDLDEHLASVVAGGGSMLIEVPGPTAEFLVQLEPYLEAGNTVQGVILILTDVTALAELRREAAVAHDDLERVVDSVEALLWMRGLDGELRILGPQIEVIYGLDRRAVLVDPSLLWSVVHPVDRDRVRALFGSAQDSWRTEYRIRRPDGQLRWIAATSRARPGGADKEVVVVGSALDVTDRVRAEGMAAEGRRVVDGVFGNEVFGVVSLDRAGRIMRANDTFAEMTGYDAPSLAGMALATIAALDRAVDPDGTTSATVLEPGVHDRRLVTRDNQSHWVTLDVCPLDDIDDVDEGGGHGGAATIVIIHDLTVLRRAGDRLVTEAHFDSQTGLANRAWFREQLAEELSRSDRAGRTIALAWIDLDGFKEVNDRHGHAAGDTVLHEIGDRLRSLGRRADLVGRLGGDEFAILVSDVEHPEGVEAVADRILDALRRPIDVGGAHVEVSGSIGIAVSASGTTADELLQNSDAAMYMAKSKGRDCRVYFEPLMNELAAERAERRQQLTAAVRSGDFVMHYQPIVDPVSGRIRAVESLVRWRRDGEVVAAGEFIELAEETGQMRGLGRLVLELVAADLERLCTVHGLSDLPVSINLSPTQLEERALVELLLAWDVAGGFGRLIAEVTEGTLIDPEGRALDALQLLRRLGTTISVDDFGTGYSNLEQLERLHPGIIKFDQSLLHRATKDRRGRALLLAATELSVSLEAEVVLEGVETEEQRQLAVELGIPMIQGYLIARPMPLDDMAEWAKAHRPI